MDNLSTQANVTTQPEPTPTIPQSNQSPPSQSTPEKSKPNYLKLVIIVMAFLLVGMGGLVVYLLQKQSTPQPVISQVAPTTQPLSSPVVEKTANWKTYNNTAFHYAIKLPSEWTIGAKGGADVTTFSSPILNSPCNYDKGDLCSQMFIETTDLNALRKNDLDYFKSLKEFDPSFIINNNDKITNKVSTKLDSESAMGFEDFQSNYGDKGRLLYVLVANHNNIKYTITYEESQKDREFITGSDWQNKNIFDQILSSFKFTDRSQSSDTSNWKTYTQASYSFKYPSTFTEEPYMEGSLKGVTVRYIGPVQQASGRTQTDLFDGLVIKTLAIINPGKTIQVLSEEYRKVDLDSMIGPSEGQEISAPAPVTIDNINAIYYTINANGTKAKVVFIPYGNNILKVTVYYAGEPSALTNYMNQGNQILSTFKFTN